MVTASPIFNNGYTPTRVADFCNQKSTATMAMFVHMSDPCLFRQCDVTDKAHILEVSCWMDQLLHQPVFPSSASFSR